MTERHMLEDLSNLPSSHPVPEPGGPDSMNNMPKLMIPGRSKRIRVWDVLLSGILIGEPTGGAAAPPTIPSPLLGLGSVCLSEREHLLGLCLQLGCGNLLAWYPKPCTTSGIGVRLGLLVPPPCWCMSPLSCCCNELAQSCPWPKGPSDEALERRPTVQGSWCGIETGQLA